MDFSVTRIAFFILETNLVLFLALILTGTAKNLKRVLLAGSVLGFTIFLIFNLPVSVPWRFLLVCLVCCPIVFLYSGFKWRHTLVVWFILLGIGAIQIVIYAAGLSLLENGGLTGASSKIYSWGTMIPLAVTTLLARMKGWRLPLDVAGTSEHSFRATGRYSVLVVAFSQLMLLFAAYLTYFRGEVVVSPDLWAIPAAFAASILLSVFIAIRMVHLHKRDALLTARTAMAESFTSLAQSTHAQNQEFIRHSERILALCREKRYQDLSHYLEQISGNISILNSVLKVDNPIIGALLRAKVTEADIRRIRLDTDVSTSLNHLGTKALAVARIIGNLIDNAFDAVAGMETDDRCVNVKVYRAGPLLQIEVSNQGPVISPEMAELIFEPGRTTKGEGHSGLGLHIVKTLAEELLGTVDVASDEIKGTCFMVTLPA
ncbi:MAG: ATP-binding protein [Bacillota bacterium]